MFFLKKIQNKYNGARFGLPPQISKKKMPDKPLLKTYYRLSDSGYAKEKPCYVDNFKCLENYISVFGARGLHIIADNVKDHTFDQLCQKGYSVERTQFGNGARSFQYVFQLALEENAPDTFVYFLENDYLHRSEALTVLMEGFGTGADYISLYDHPDKYVQDRKHGNRLILSGGELTRVLLTDSVHWKLTNSTTMTFASRIQTLREDRKIISEFTMGKHPHDFDMFMKLREKGRSLITPIPGYSTHGESKWLCPLTDWSKI